MTTTVHWRTPVVAANDPRGLSVRQIACLRRAAGQSVETLITRHRHDAAGRRVEQWDPRLFESADSANQSTDYRLSGEPLKVDSVDAGWRLSLFGLAGEELQRWDARGGHWRITYDEQLRPMAIDENGRPNVENFFYADVDADCAFNLRGQLTEHLDSSGTLSFESYSLRGLPMRETRTLAGGDAFTSRRRYSPLGSTLSQTDAGDHQQQARYDLAGQLKQVDLLIKGGPTWQTVLNDAQYNAAGQIIKQQAGNHVLSTWTYDLANGRLCTQRAQKETGPTLRDIEYFYDPVGNITRIEDHLFEPIHFANQRVDGHRDFTYDSLSRLTRATGYDDSPPSEVPGRPLPGDPDNRLNYTQDYQYDPGGNLIKLRHIRAGASYTRDLCIDPASNRAVRWQEGDPAPEFPSLFDPHGNLLALQPGNALRWNSLDQLESVTLVQRDEGPDDEEFYRYSQGVRVFKRHETHTASVTHFQQVIYLPGLEIRTRDNGEELHVITLPGGHGNVRCLHWKAGKPAHVPADQLRYSLDDHLGSCALELDQQAQVISQEGYYPFGATAWFARGNEVEVDYKTVRYSGQEMDDSGLYYYGARYYAPWLQRWISADPAGDVDGLNLYAFVGNNPLRYTDKNGAARFDEVIYNYSNFVTVLEGYATQTLAQLDNVFHQTDIAMDLLKNFTGESINAAIGFLGGFYGAQAGGVGLPDAPHTVNFTSQGKPPFSEGLTGGNLGAELGGGAGGSTLPMSGLIRPLVPQTTQMSIAAIDRQLGLSADEGPDWMAGAANIFLNNVVGSVVPGISAVLAMGSRVQEAEDMKNRLDPAKIMKIERMLDEWQTVDNQRYANADAAFDIAGADIIYPATLFPNVNGMTDSSLLEPIQRSALKQQHARTQDLITRAKTGMAHYKEMGSTDNQFLLKQARDAHRQREKN